MAKTTPIFKFLKGALGDLIEEKMMPDVDVGALGKIDNQNIETIKKGDDLKFQKKGMLGETTPTENKSVGQIDFQLFSEDGDIERFANKSMNDEIINAIKTGNFDDAKNYMNKIQEKLKDLGAQDSEPSAIIDSILENYFFGSE